MTFLPNIGPCGGMLSAERVSNPLNELYQIGQLLKSLKLLPRDVDVESYINSLPLKEITSELLKTQLDINRIRRVRVKDYGVHIGDYIVGLHNADLGIRHVGFSIGYNGKNGGG
jgi:hypothetical protein